jgi:uncharacterized protein with NRDE domain
MCLVLFSYQPGEERPLVVAANRDEFYARPARSAHHWDDAPRVFAGRDLFAGGSWLGVTTTGRFATVTNFAEETPDELAPKSRGELVDSFLTSDLPAHDYAHGIHGPDYKGFNLLLYDGDKLVYTSNRGITEDLGAGVYGLANAELGATWPKVVSGTESLQAVCSGGPTTGQLIDLLHDDAQPSDEDLPRRGRPVDLERRVAPCFIRGEEYGTRASTAIIYATLTDGQVIRFVEQNYHAGGVPADRTEATLDIATQP